MVCGGFADVEFAEDAADVSLECLRAEEELLADALVGVSLCHEREHLALAGRKFGERPRVAPVADETGDDGGVDDALSISDSSQRVGQRANFRDAVFQEVALGYRPAQRLTR
jgi:hypothetical protein